MCTLHMNCVVLRFVFLCVEQPNNCIKTLWIRFELRCCNTIFMWHHHHFLLSVYRISSLEWHFVAFVSDNFSLCQYIRTRFSDLSRSVFKYVILIMVETLTSKIVAYHETCKRPNNGCINDDKMSAKYSVCVHDLEWDTIRHDAFF